MTRNVRIDYTINPEVALDDVKDAIQAFVAGIASHHPDHRYSSFQYASDPRRFIHVGEIVEEVIEDFQAAPFFQKFSQFLRENCASGPEVTFLNRVAFTPQDAGRNLNRSLKSMQGPNYCLVLQVATSCADGENMKGKTDESAYIRRSRNDQMKSMEV